MKKKKKIIVVGGVAGGASCAVRLRRLDEGAVIKIYERGEYISYANCGLPYHIGGVIRRKENLILVPPQKMERRFNIKVKVKQEVISIDRENRKIKVKNLATGRIYQDSYDYLVLSPGAKPFIPPIEGVDNERVLTLRTIPDMERIKEAVEKWGKHVVIIGGGYIGVEVAENLRLLGCQVVILEKESQILSFLSPEISYFAKQRLEESGIEVVCKVDVEKIKTSKQRLEIFSSDGNSWLADFVVLGVGVKPESELAQSAGLEIGDRGGILVNKYMQTSDQSIYAVGDVVEVEHLVTKERVHLPLAAPANFQGRLAADNICGYKREYKGALGTSIIKVGDWAFGSVGLNRKILEKKSLDYGVVQVVGSNRVNYYPGATLLLVELLFEKSTGKILGMQIGGPQDVDKKLDTVAALMKMGGTVYDLEELELAYAPPFGAAKDILNKAGYIAANSLRGDAPLIWSRELEEKMASGDYFLLDVRTASEFFIERIPGSYNIQLEDLRDNLGVLPRNKKIIVYCATGYRSYIAQRILLQHGWEVENLTGGIYFYNLHQKT